MTGDLSSFSGKRVLITGHTGFKGAWLSLWLKSLGATVYGYALPPINDSSLFSQMDPQDVFASSCFGDISNINQLREYLTFIKPEVIFHLAAQSFVNRSYANPVETYATNVMGTINLLDVVRGVKSVKAVVIVSSDKCYENQDWVWGYRESDPMGGFDPYSSSKGCVEILTSSFVRSFFKDSDTAIASARAGNVIGGGDWGENRLVPDLIRALWDGKPLILRNPKSTRPWQHVLEPLHGYLVLGNKLMHGGNVFSGGWNFGPDEIPCEVSRLAELFYEIAEGGSWETDESSKLHEASYLNLDCSKAKALLDWRPCWNLRKTVKETFAWYEALRRQENVVQYSLGQIKDFEIDLSKLT